MHNLKHLGLFAQPETEYTHGLRILVLTLRSVVFFDALKDVAHVIAVQGPECKIA